MWQMVKRKYIAVDLIPSRMCQKRCVHWSWLVSKKVVLITVYPPMISASFLFFLSGEKNSRNLDKYVILSITSLFIFIIYWEMTEKVMIFPAKSHDYDYDYDWAMVLKVMLWLFAFCQSHSHDYDFSHDFSMTVVIWLPYCEYWHFHCNFHFSSCCEMMKMHAQCHTMWNPPS